MWNKMSEGNYIFVAYQEKYLKIMLGLMIYNSIAQFNQLYNEILKIFKIINTKLCWWSGILNMWSYTIFFLLSK